ncbi:hypothetical protein K1719_009461 [Acacia pycnantha]|nr:hypothetical protein K1719_009461 [Acacia pycnantha]
MLRFQAIGQAHMIRSSAQCLNSPRTPSCISLKQSFLARGSWVNFLGNIGKVLISLVTIFYDSVFMFQHYVLYLGKKAGVGAKADGKMREPLICPNSIDVTDQQIKDLQKSCDRPLPQEEMNLFKLHTATGMELVIGV